MQRDIYWLIANQLRDIHLQLEEKIKSSRTHSPKWAVSQIEGTNTFMVEELSPLVGIADLLEKLAGPLTQQQIVLPNEE